MPPASLYVAAFLQPRVDAASAARHHCAACCCASAAAATCHLLRTLSTQIQLDDQRRQPLAEWRVKPQLLLLRLQLVLLLLPLHQLTLPLLMVYPRMQMPLLL
jgi:hypothetical protein